MISAKRNRGNRTVPAAPAAKSTEAPPLGISFELLTSKVDLHKPGIPWDRRRAIGKSLQQKHPRELHANWKLDKNRPSPLELINASNAGRQKEFIPLRMGRMAQTPFTFFRGAACVMAYDLKDTPVSGISVVIDGDAHVNNFGLYGTPQRDVVFDLNDFDETTIGPWEWDLKRLVASVNVAARENGMNKAGRETAVLRAVESYRRSLDRIEPMGVLDVWYLHYYPNTNHPLLEEHPKAQAVIEKCVAKAKRETNAALLKKICHRRPNGSWYLPEDPPILVHVDDKTREKVIQG